MKVTEPQAWHHFLEDGVIQGEKVKSYRKYLREAASLFASTEGEDPDTLLYTVYSYEAGDARKKGDLYWGMTVLEPVTIHGECNMTRGHFHMDWDCAEFYFGISGTGLLLLMDEDGKAWAERVAPGSLHHIDGHLAHQLINTGGEVLRVGACWPTTAGHDYGSTEKMPFPCRVYKRNGEIVWEENK